MEDSHWESNCFCLVNIYCPLHITVCTRTFHWTLSGSRRIQSTHLCL